MRRATVFAMLGLLLFASGLQVDLGEIRKRRIAVWSLATVGVFLSTLLVGLGVWAVAKVSGADLPLPWAFAFGALISPTDPIAVLAAMRSGAVSPRLGAVLQGEALFNDGVGFVPAENLEGKAELILLSWGKGASLFKPWTWVLNARPSRFFNVLH